jgi:hypothetical protein
MLEIFEEIVSQSKNKSEPVKSLQDMVYWIHP